MCVRNDDGTSCSWHLTFAFLLAKHPRIAYGSLLAVAGNVCRCRSTLVSFFFSFFSHSSLDQNLPGVLHMLHWTGKEHTACLPPFLQPILDIDRCCLITKLHQTYKACRGIHHAICNGKYHQTPSREGDTGRAKPRHCRSMLLVDWSNAGIDMPNFQARPHFLSYANAARRRGRTRGLPRPLGRALAVAAARRPLSGKGQGGGRVDNGS